MVIDRAPPLVEQIDAWMARQSAIRQAFEDCLLYGQGFLTMTNINGSISLTHHDPSPDRLTAP